MVPGLTGGGAIVKAVTKLDDAADAAKSIVKVADDLIETGANIERYATSGSPNKIGKVGEMLAGIDPSAKTKIFVNGRTRIPDGLTPTVLTEVKNVKYISNTQQLKDFADFASLTGRSLELYVRPTTKIAKTVIDAGWNIKYLW